MCVVCVRGGGGVSYHSADKELFVICTLIANIFMAVSGDNKSTFCSPTLSHIG